MPETVTVALAVPVRGADPSSPARRDPSVPATAYVVVAAGQVHTTAIFEGTCPAADPGQTVADVHILHNSTAATSGHLNTQGAGNSTTLDLDVNVAAGDTIDFTFVGPNANNTLNWTATVDARVCKRSAPHGG